MTAWGSDTFRGKLNGIVQKFTINTNPHTGGEEVLDGNGQPVDATQIEYPTYDPTLGLTMSQGWQPSRHAVVNRDELGIPDPAPALPIAYGDEEDDEPTAGESFGPTYAARQYAHVRQALKEFSASEKADLINEGDEPARIEGYLDVSGTHYQQQPSEGDTDWMWGW